MTLAVMNTQYGVVYADDNEAGRENWIGCDD